VSPWRPAWRGRVNALSTDSRREAVSSDPTTPAEENAAARAAAGRLVPICHASEDEERFVLDFAKRLRKRGLDAWLDAWEIQAGDSLPQRIFEGAVGHASAVVIIVSATSVEKPWVRKELRTSVVRHIEENIRLIPVVLDDGVPVPTALSDLLWLRSHSLGLTVSSRLSPRRYSVRAPSPLSDRGRGLQPLVSSRRLTTSSTPWCRGRDDTAA
jgi:TIR domain-containing protein